MKTLSGMDLWRWGRAGERGQGLSGEALMREALVYERSLLLPSVISQCIQV